MPRYSVLAGEGLDATVARMQRQLVLFYETANARALDLPEPWLGAVSLIGANMSLEGWDGTRWLPLGFIATAAPPPTFGTQVTSPLVIPDPVGNVVPQLEFEAGDGDTVYPGPYTHYLHLYQDALRVTSGRNIGKPIAYFKRTGTSTVQLGLEGWLLQDDESGGTKLLEFWHGGTRHAYVDNAGNVVANAALWATNVYASSLMQTVYLQGPSGALICRSSGYVDLQGYGGLGAPAAQMLVGNAYGSGNAPKVSVAGQPTGGGWAARPLSVHKSGGAGEVGMAFVNHVNGWTGGLQLFYDGAFYLGILNGDNTGYIKTYASAFTVISTRRYKAEVERLSTRRGTASSSSRIVEQLEPVRYRDLQNELAASPGCTATTPDGRPGTPQVVEPRYRFGLVAEEVAEVAPELVDSSHLGPGIDLSGLVAVLWQAVKELSARVAQLELEQGATA